ALGHWRHADERDGARRLREPLADQVRGDLGERHAAFAEPGLAAHARRDLQRFIEYEAEHRACETERLRALVALPDLADDLRLADTGGIEPGGNQEEMLGRPFAAPRTQAPLGFARSGRTAGQELERLRAQVRARRLGRAREDQLNPVAGREIRELPERIAARERAEPLSEVLVVEGEFGEAFRAALAPRHADHGKMIEHERRSSGCVGRSIWIA